jgi:hypothetical protein
LLGNPLLALADAEGGGTETAADHAEGGEDELLAGDVAVF